MRGAALVVAIALAAASGAAAAARPPDAAELAAHVAALTASPMEGRGSGSPGGDRAARYIADRLADMGLKPGGEGGTFLQSFAVGSAARAASDASLERLGPSPSTLVLGRDWTPHGGSLGGEVAGEVVFVGHGAPGPDGGAGDYAGLDVKNKIALALDGGPDGGASRLDKLIAARRHGAAALLIASDSLPSLASTATSTRLLSASITRAAADQLIAPSGHALSALAPEPTGIRARLRVSLDREERRTANVIGILPGVDPALASEAIVVGAHYDHLGRVGGVVHPGADDNASGTAVVLGLARALSATGGLGRTVVFAQFSGEEMGLLGSAHYVKHPAIPIERTTAMINFDMVGRLRNDRLTLGGVESGAGLRAVVSQATAGERLDVAMRDSPYGPSDHTSFYTAGVPVLFFHTGSHEDYHTPRDTADRLNPAGMADIARVALRIVEQLAASPRPGYVQIARPAAGERMSGAGSGSAFLGVSVNGQSEADGVTLRSVIAGSAAARAGLRDGDVILRLDDRPLGRFEDLRRMLAERRPGDQVTLVYLRDGEDRTTTAVLDKRP